jgi:putative ABC transport system permease protein
MIRARLTHINGQPIESRALQSGRGRMFAEREQNLSWASELEPGNRIVAGRWWSADDRERRLVSVASEYQQELDLALGDRMTFDVAGETVTARIASFREVHWDSFRPNFFLVFNPGTLEALTGTWMTSLQLDARGKRRLAGLVRSYPGISVFDVDALLRQVRDAMDRAAIAVQAVFLFTITAGTAVLLAAVQSTRDERRYESAILRTLGARRAVVLKGVATEFLVLGLLAGLLAATGAVIAGWILATQVFDLRYAADPRVWLWGIVAGTLIVGGTGTLAARGVVRQPPLTTLRGG